MKTNNNIQVRKFNKRQISAKKETQAVMPAIDLMASANGQKRVLSNSINQPGKVKRPFQKSHTYANQVRPQSSTYRSGSKAQKTQYSISMSFMNQEEINSLLSEIIEKSSKITKMISETGLKQKDLVKIYQDVTMKINLGFLKVQQDLTNIEEQMLVRIKKYSESKQCTQRYNACESRIQKMLKNRIDRLISLKSR